MSNSLPLVSEENEQATFVQWLELQGLLFTAVPNSTYTTSWKQKAKNTRTGLRPGFPDMMVVIPHVGLLCIELKRVKRGVISPAQQTWHEALNTLPGVQAFIAYGADEAIAIVSKYLPAQITDTSLF